MILETSRLCLRELTREDHAALKRVLGDTRIMCHYPYVFDDARVENWIERNLRRYREDGFGLWAVCLKDGGELIGDCGLTLQAINGQTLPEIGYHIRRDCQRQGYASEAAKAVCDWAFTHTPYKALYSYCKYTNEPSYRTAEKIGMRFFTEYPDEANGMSRVSRVTRAEWLTRGMGLCFRVATAEDRAAVANLYESVKGAPFCTWNEYYPGDIELDADIPHGNLFVLTDAAGVIGAVSAVGENELDELDFWREKDAAEFGRLCVAPHMQGRGLSAVLTEGIEAEIRRRGRRAIHILAAKKNVPALRGYLSAGYAPRGDCEMFGNEYTALEKTL